MNLSSPAAPRRSPRAAQAGSTLIVAMLVIAVLSIIAGQVLTSISSRYNSAYRSAGWNDALRAAESGVDITLASILSQLPDVHATTGGVGLGFTQPSLVSLGVVPSFQMQPGALLTNGTLLSIKNLQLPAVTGEGGTVQQSTISLKVGALNDLVTNGSLNVLGTASNVLNSTANLQLLTLVSTGTVQLTGRSVAGPLRQDNDLWKASLLMDRFTGNALTTPVISRQIQVILRPVYPFESAVVANDALQAPDSGSTFDSFNSSLLSLNNTGGVYDSLKRLSHGTVRSNLASVTLGGTVYGDASTNGGTLGAKDANGVTHVTGTVNNAAFASLPFVNVPAWVSSTPASTLSGTVALPSANIFGSSQYRFNSISGNLHITGSLLPTTVLIYVDGDITGGIEVDPNVTAKIYVAGSINTNASRLKNDGQTPGNFQIYGVPPGTGAPPSININLDANVSASIYAPGDNVTLTAPSKNGGDFSGSVVANQFKTVGAVHVHYDESLALNVGPILRFQIASWKEITN